MAKMIRHDYVAIHNAMNKMVIKEVKAALSMLPDKMIDGGSLCRVVVSPECDYEPRDLCVEKVWIDDEGVLCFTGTENHGSFVVDDDPDPWTENDDLLDITDFSYLIDQIAEKVDADLEEEPEKVWIVKQESNVDGQIIFNVTPCKDRETAVKVVADEVHTLLTESTAYRGALDYIEGRKEVDDDCPFSWDGNLDGSEGFYIANICDDYYEQIIIEEKVIN